MKGVRDHERGIHEDYSEETRDELRQARESLMAPDASTVETGRYAFIRV